MPAQLGERLLPVADALHCTHRAEGARELSGVSFISKGTDIIHEGSALMT